MVAIARTNAAAVKEIALIESGLISVRRNLMAGQFKPHKMPISKKIKTFIKL